MIAPEKGPKHKPGSKSGSSPGSRGNHVAATSRFNNFKNCTKCGERKRLADYSLTTHWRKKRAADPKRYKGMCKKCCRAPSANQVDANFKSDLRPRERISRTPQEQLALNATYKRAARRAVRIKALEYVAEKGCCDCGTHDPRVLEFDHIDPAEKHSTVARLLGDGFGWGSEKLRQEIRKCRVICANCHRLHTAAQQEYYSHTDVRESLQIIFDEYGIT